MKIGFIGTGNMGSILVSSFIEAKAIEASSVMVTNRTIAKANALQERYSALQVAPSAQEVIAFANIIFMCVKPHQFMDILPSHQQWFTKEKLLVSITSPLQCEELEKVVPCSVARAIPSITNRALAGASLLTFGTRCTAKQKEQLQTLFDSISTPLLINNDITRVSSDIASCGPAFIGYVLQCMINSAVAQTKISNEQATELTSQMIIGMGKLLEKKIFTLPTLVEKVCVKGGITGEGIKILQEDVEHVFDKVIQRTHEKYDDERAKIAQQFQAHHSS
ncbi:late competence protein ComER [Fictibacillus macauensis ZFHKF-1]|uniref:Pyrroline-5-carboxylate reductase n=1 Tax=Fictibacillus macauensis ZFHKF-1 TaxID=1196324 RepID=I8J0G8_9BACL|nr:late competence protein ComER [Fictibacillus macauensis]EIT85241.1 late competence protein ComER [Fictibacillus macauensis ZFHKF-1]